LETMLRASVWGRATTSPAVRASQRAITVSKSANSDACPRRTRHTAPRANATEHAVQNARGWGGEEGGG
jgi:hypothetical protein